MKTFLEPLKIRPFELKFERIKTQKVRTSDLLHLINVTIYETP
jgi:hypothetical protein